MGAAARSGERAFLDLLDRRLAGLAALADGRAVTPRELGLDAGSRTAARRVLRRHEAAWHDGDENLVRGLLHGWGRDEGSPARRARVILEAASSLAATEARRETLWFFAWHLESILPGVVEAGGAGD